MTNNQLAGLIVTLFLAAASAFKLYLDAKVNPIKEQVDLLVNYMIQHEGKIATLVEKTKHL